MRFSSSSRMAAATLCGVLAWATAPAASAVSISGVSATLAGANTPNLFNDVGPIGSQISSSAGVTSSAAMQFITRYQAGVYTDAGGTGAATNSITLNASYTVSFNLINSLGNAWRLDIDTRRTGARTAVTDGIGSSAYGLSDVTVLIGGIGGTLTSGTLGLPAIGPDTQSNSMNRTFNQTANALLEGSGDGTITLTFNFTANAQSIVAGSGASAQGDEAGIRMGLPGTLSSFSAGNYPGTGNRNAANDGHFIDLLIIDLGPIPEPGTAALFGLGLALLGGWRRGERHQGRSRH